MRTMNRIDIANGIVFQRMHISKDTFDERLICQKKIYLLQALGTNLGYSYNWYVHGPYSPALTSYVYNSLDGLSTSSFDGFKLNELAETNIRKVNNLAEKCPEELTVSLWYELLASILYIKQNQRGWNLDGSDESLYEALMKAKPRFSKQHCKNALETLQSLGFC